MNFKDIPIGIDLGTTNSCIGAFRNGIVEIIPNQISERTTPSIVSFCGEKISIGEQTKNKIFNEAEKIIYSVKRIIGKKYDDPHFNKLIYNLAYKNIIKPDETNRPIINVDFKGQSYYPEEISAMVLKRLKENAESYLNQKIKKVVITIPAYFTETQREATKIAGEGAGLEVIKIINEPTAAALAYALGEKKDILRSDDDDNFFLLNANIPSEDNFEEKIILVFDLGGGTLDVTCLKIIKDDEFPQIEIQGHSGNTLLGGDDFDDILVNHCIHLFKKEFKIDINNRNPEDLKARKRLKIACERAKKILSFQPETRIIIESLYNNHDLSCNITRVKFESLCNEKFKEMIKPVEDALKFSGLKKDDINEIVLVGGSTRIPKIEEKLKEFFGEKVKFCKSINPDEVVAYGATLQAAISMNAESLTDILVNDVCSHSLGLAIKKGNEGDIFDKLIENGTNIPFEATKKYTTVTDNQKTVLIEIFEGENKFCRNNRSLGKFRLTNLTEAKKGVPQINVKFEIDEDSIVHVTAKETISGVTNSIVIKYDKGIMKKDQINNMIEKLKNKKDFEENKIDENEKELIEKKKLLIQDYKNNNNRSLSSLKELEKIQEKLIEISINENNKNNIDKRYNNVKFLFKLYNYFFSNYYNDYKELSKEYLKKIKIYLDIFKNDETFYIKTLVLIFKDDNYANRISEIVYYSINLYMDYIKNPKNKKFSLYYYIEALDLITIFRNKIIESNLKFKFNILETNCKIERDKLLIQKEEKNINLKKNLNHEEVLSAIDQYTYIIEKYGVPDENSPTKEKELRSYLLAKLVNLEFNFLKIKDLKKLKKMSEESLSLAEKCNLTCETDSWVRNISEIKEKIIKLIDEQEKSELNNNINNSLNQMISKDINGNDDKENIDFLKYFDSEFMKDNQNKENVEEMYKTDGEKLINRRLSIVRKIPDVNEEIKKKKNKIKIILNKIKTIFKKKNKK